MPDTVPILRVNLATRALDTAAYVKISIVTSSMTEDDMSAMRIAMKSTPLPVVDDWALLPDGRIAIVRGKDYHVDWLGIDGTWTTTAKIPYAWERLDDDGKQKVLDSVRVAMEKNREAMTRTMAGTAITSSAAAGGARSAGGNSGGSMFQELGTAGPSEGVGRAPKGAPQFSAPQVSPVDAKDLPDYRPAFRQGAVRVDDTGNLWVRTTAPSDAGAIYDVISAQGVLIDRVRLPFFVISGFGNGVVFMGVQDGTGARLEMARVR